MLIKILLKILAIDTAGEREDKLIDVLLKYLDHSRIETWVLEDGMGKPNLVAAYGSNKPRISLISHCDTVPVGPLELWKHNPYGEVSDGKVYGRGAIDNKGPLAAMLWAFINLVEDRVKGVRFVVFSDEERQREKSGARWVIKHKWDLVKSEYALGEGGGAINFRGDKCLLVGYGERGGAEYHCRFISRSGHTALHGENPLAILLGKILDGKIEIVDNRADEDISILLEALKLNKVAKAIAKRFSELRTLLRAYNTIEANITYASLGGNHGYYNVSPSVLDLALNLRLVPGISKREVDGIVQNIFKEYLTDGSICIIKNLAFIPGYKSPLENPFLDFIKMNVADYGYSRVIPIIMPASSDLSWFREKGVPSYGLFPSEASVVNSFLTAHTPNEYIGIRELEVAANNFYSILKDFKMEVS